MNTHDTSVSVEKTDKFTSTKVGDDVIVFDDVKGEYLGLGETGSAIYDLIDGPVRISLIIEQLAQTYDVGEQELETDVMSFLYQLISRDLIKIV